MVYLTTISMYYVLYKMGNSKSETESMKIKKLKMIAMHVQMTFFVNLRAPHCLVARTPLLSCAQWLFMYTRVREKIDHSHSFYTGSTVQKLPVYATVVAIYWIT